MDTFFPLLFGFLSSLVVLMTSVIVYLILKPIEKVAPSSSSHGHDRNFHAP